MKKLLICCFTVLNSGILHAQDCAVYPADCPETEWIAQSQSRQNRLDNGILPQEIDMQDKMRALITVMMKKASQALHWDMIELKEYTNDGGLQSGGTPYPLRSPRGIDITFQFIVNQDSLLAWKNYQAGYDKAHSNDISQDYNNITATTESPLYKRYKDSADHYMKLYITYAEQHKDEGTALYTKDKHPAYYQKKQTEFLDKMTALTDQTHENAGIESKEIEHDRIARRFRSSTVVQVEFHVNAFAGSVIDEALGPIEATSKPLQINNVKLARLYTIGNDETTLSLYKWTHAILLLLGNFHTTPDEDYKYNYEAGFKVDEHTPKKIKSDKVQNTSIGIVGNKRFIEKMLEFIDVEKLNGTMVKF